MVFKKRVIIDCQGHLIGRLSSIIAKELLKGQHVVCVRCEELNISGSLYRNRLKYQQFLRKRMSTNPSRGPYHFRAPSRILWRTIRGMLPHKTPRGMKALARLQVFEGVPSMLERKKRVVVPCALRVTRLKPLRNFCRLGDISSKVGWRHGDLIKRLEARRKDRSATFFKKKSEAKKIMKEAKDFANSVLPKEQKAFLQDLGHA